MMEIFMWITLPARGALVRIHLLITFRALVLAMSTQLDIISILFYFFKRKLCQTFNSLDDRN